jgi:hypothetical protein
VEEILAQDIVSDDIAKEWVWDVCLRKGPWQDTNPNPVLRGTLIFVQVGILFLPYFDQHQKGLPEELAETFIDHVGGSMIGGLPFALLKRGVESKMENLEKRLKHPEALIWPTSEIVMAGYAENEDGFSTTQRNYATMQREAPEGLSEVWYYLSNQQDQDYHLWMHAIIYRRIYADCIPAAYESVREEIGFDEILADTRQEFMDRVGQHEQEVLAEAQKRINQVMRKRGIPEDFPYRIADKMAKQFFENYMDAVNAALQQNS